MPEFADTVPQLRPKQSRCTLLCPNITYCSQISGHTPKYLRRLGIFGECEDTLESISDPLTAVTGVRIPQGVPNLSKGQGFWVLRKPSLSRICQEQRRTNLTSYQAWRIETITSPFDESVDKLSQVKSAVRPLLYSGSGVDLRIKCLASDCRGIVGISSDAWIRHTISHDWWTIDS